MKEPLWGGMQWYWPGKPSFPGACWVAGTTESLDEARGLLEDLGARPGVPLALIVLDEGRYEGRWPFVRLPSAGPDRVLRRLAPAQLIFLQDHPALRALAAVAPCPVLWVNGQSPALLGLGQVAVGSHAQAERIGGGVVIGDPCVEWLAEVPSWDNPSFCERFQAVRRAGRWVLYCAGTAAGEETIAYSTFLNVSAQSGGLLALAPADETRHEAIYRESIKYHLLTVRQLRLMTSEVPPKTRVYYIESAAARLAMSPCADLIVMGGTWMEGSVPFREALWAGVSVLVGPHHGADPWVRAAARAGAVTVCADSKALAIEAARLLGNREAREYSAKALRDWLTLQPEARRRFVALLGHPSS